MNFFERDYNKKALNFVLILFMITLLGAFLNIIAVKSNDGRMPVLTYSYTNTNEHFNFVEKEEIKYYALSDIYKIETKDHIAHFSIGDVLMYLGLFPAGIFLSIHLFLLGYGKIKKIWRKGDDYGFKI